MGELYKLVFDKHNPIYAYSDSVYFEVYVPNISDFKEGLKCRFNDRIMTEQQAEEAKTTHITEVLDDNDIDFCEECLERNNFKLTLE